MFIQDVFGPTRASLFHPLFTKCISRRLSWHTLVNQSVNLLPIFAFALFIAIVRYAADGTTAPWWFIFKPVLESVTAFLVGWVMLKLINRRSGSALTARPQPKNKNMIFSRENQKVSSESKFPSIGGFNRTNFCY